MGWTSNHSGSNLESGTTRGGRSVYPLINLARKANFDSMINEVELTLFGECTACASSLPKNFMILVYRSG